MALTLEEVLVVPPLLECASADEASTMSDAMAGVRATCAEFELDPAAIRDADGYSLADVLCVMQATLDGFHAVGAL